MVNEPKKNASKTFDELIISCHNVVHTVKPMPPLSHTKLPKCATTLQMFKDALISRFGTKPIPKPSVLGSKQSNGLAVTSTSRNLGINGSTNTFSFADGTINDHALSPWGLQANIPKHLLGSNVSIWASALMPDTDIVHFHISVWLEITKPPDYSYGWMVVGTACDSPSKRQQVKTASLVFDSKEARDAFTSWINTYSERFAGGDWEKRYFPGIKIGQKVSGFAHPIQTVGCYGDGVYNGVHVNWLEEWKWIVGKTYDPVLLADGYWLFENESELLMFKMRDNDAKVV